MGTPVLGDVTEEADRGYGHPCVGGWDGGGWQVCRHWEPLCQGDGKEEADGGGQAPLFQGDGMEKADRVAGTGHPYAQGWDGGG